ncbi:NAD(P)H-dependent oxidoreductase [Paraglaciecola sp.]|uniref:NADPH-dependent FMN reductase n=1 Tax=Paraglaciecola sp. TaxID=1920173 RepID=UPI003264BB50
MKIGIICGSQRANSQTSKVGNYIEAKLNAAGVSSYLIDLGVEPLPSFEDSFWYEKNGTLQAKWQPVADELKSCDGFVVVTPDWHGMVPSCLKNLFLFASAAEMANKPGLIVAVSSTVGGYLPVAELRISSYKNNRICWIPDHIIIRNVKTCLNDTEQAEGKDDMYIRARLQHSLSLLTEYARALDMVRLSKVADYDTYQYGM